MKIKDVNARQILDSRGNPTVECEVIAKSEKRKAKSYGASGGFRDKDTIVGVASVPSGASTGSHEALELRDGEMVHFWGKGVQKAVDKVERVIGPALLGMEVTEQEQIDRRMIELDGTENKSELGANAILAVSLACARAAAEAEGLWLFEYLSRVRLTPPNPPLNKGGNRSLRFPLHKEGDYSLPIPFMNVINGGKHAVDGVDFQEFMIVPQGFDSFAEALESGTEVFMKLKEILHQDGFQTLVGDEGGFAPAFNTNEQALEYLVRVIEEAGFKPGEQIGLAMDPAVSELFNKQTGKYELKKEGLSLDAKGIVDYWQGLLDRFPIVSIEDGLDQDAWEDWQIMTKRLGDRVQLVGDDFLVTNAKRLQRAIDEQACNAILIKLNQIGTVSETIDVINMAQKNGFRCMVSHRSGETEDTFIADLAVGMGTGQIKAGSLSRSERVAKYNRLLKIEEQLGERAKFGKLII